MRSLVLMLIAGLYGGINYYLSTRVLTVTQSFLPINGTLVVRGIVIALTASTLVTYLLANRNVGPFIGKVGTYWFGFSLLAVAIIGITDIGLFVSRYFMTVKHVPLIMLLVFCLTISLVVYGTWQANRLKVTDYHVTLQKKSALKELKVVLISDLHLGYVNDAPKLAKLVQSLNRLKPDLVCIAGDLFDGNFEAVEEPGKIRESLNQIKTTYGTFLIWGNHDAGENFDKMSEFVKSTELILLTDTSYQVEDKFVIIGRKDSSPIGKQEGPRQDVTALMKAAEKLPLIVLDHQPSNWRDYHGAADLVLSGHTHQGQVFPLNVITRQLYDVDYGHGKHESGTQIVVSSGAGTWGPPLRIGTASEIVQIKIRFSESV